MDLTYNDLKKREVINVADGRSFGKITNLKISFPSGEVVGIFVPGAKQNCILALFNKAEIYIDQSKIIKIGGDVILVNVGTCDYIERAHHKPPKPCPPEKKPTCPPPCPPLCPPPKNTQDGDFDGEYFGEDYYNV